MRARKPQKDYLTYQLRIKTLALELFTQWLKADSTLDPYIMANKAHTAAIVFYGVNCKFKEDLESNKVATWEYEDVEG